MFQRRVAHGYGRRAARGRLVAGRVRAIQGCPACRSRSIRPPSARPEGAASRGELAGTDAPFRGRDIAPAGIGPVRLRIDGAGGCCGRGGIGFSGLPSRTHRAGGLGEGAAPAAPPPEAPAPSSSPPSRPRRDPHKHDQRGSRRAPLPIVSTTLPVRPAFWAPSSRRSGASTVSALTAPLSSCCRTPRSQRAATARPCRPPLPAAPPPGGSGRSPGTPRSSV